MMPCWVSQISVLAGSWSSAGLGIVAMSVDASKKGMPNSLRAGCASAGGAAGAVGAVGDGTMALADGSIVGDVVPDQRRHLVDDLMRGDHPLILPHSLNER